MEALCSIQQLQNSIIKTVSTKHFLTRSQRSQNLVERSSQLELLCSMLNTKPYQNSKDPLRPCLSCKTCSHQNLTGKKLVSG